MGIVHSKFIYLINTHGIQVVFKTNDEDIRFALATKLTMGSATDSPGEGKLLNSRHILTKAIVRGAPVHLYF